MAIDDRCLIFNLAVPIAIYGNQTHIRMPLLPLLVNFGEPKTKQEKNQARLKHLRGRAGRWS